MAENGTESDVPESDLPIREWKGISGNWPGGPGRPDPVSDNAVFRPQRFLAIIDSNGPYRSREYHR